MTTKWLPACWLWLWHTDFETFSNTSHIFKQNEFNATVFFLVCYTTKTPFNLLLKKVILFWFRNWKQIHHSNCICI